MGYITAYAYDSMGRKTNEIAANGTADAVTTSFGYNGASDMVSLRDGRGDSTTWIYDAYGRVVSKHDANNTEILRYQYDANSRLTNRWSLAKGNTAYGYDAVGNRTSVSYPVSPSISFGYDNANRLASMSDAIGLTYYTYDAMGLMSSEVGPWLNDAVSFSNTATRQRGRLQIQQPDAPNWIQSYGYDAANRLTTLSSSAGTFSYQYGANYPGNQGRGQTIDWIGFVCVRLCVLGNGRRYEKLWMAPCQAHDLLWLCPAGGPEPRVWSAQRSAMITPIGYQACRTPSA